MNPNLNILQRIDQINRQHPRSMWLVNLILLVFVTMVLLTTTEAPLVLYQAF